MKNKMILLGLILFVSCSTIRLQVKSPYKSSQGNGHVTYEQTYSLGGMPLWCGLSAVFWGGACWAYLGMPFQYHQEALLQDTEHLLKARLGSQDVVLEKPDVRRISWSSAEPYFSLEEPNTPAQ